MSITEAEFNYLRETLTKDLVVMLMEKKNMTMEEAFRCFYDSETCRKLALPDTGLFFQSPGYVYSYLENETNIHTT